MLYMARCILEMKTPMHCGRGSDGSNTSPVTTDAYGFWRIPGSSVAGVLRNHVRINRGEELACELFGREERGPNQSSLVWVSDAVLLDYDGAPLWKKVVAGQEPLLQIKTFFRDRVSLDFVTGTVEKGKKFNEEYVPAGTRFALEILLNNWEDELDPKVLEAFAFVVKSLELGQVHFGGKSSCGYGSYRLLTAQLRKLDPHDPKQMEQWLQLLDSPLYPEKFGQPWEAVPTKAMPKTDSISGLLTIPLCTQDPILIAGGMPVDGLDADLCFASTACYDYEHKGIQEYLVLPGSSLRGVVRHRVYQILKILGVDPLVALNDIFGGVEQEIKRGKLSFFDAPLYVTDKPALANNCQTVQHVSIDRFTGETMDAHLFNEAPLWHKEVFFSMTVRVNDLTPWQAGILMHALLDLAQGSLPVGNGTRRGNGRVMLDKKRKLCCELLWNGEELRADDAALARQWLSKIAKACKEKGYAAAV